MDKILHQIHPEYAEWCLENKAPPHYMSELGLDDSRYRTGPWSLCKEYDINSNHDVHDISIKINCDACILLNFYNEASRTQSKISRIVMLVYF
jgi:hypothetical protein